MSPNQNETFDPERVTTIYRLLRALDFQQARALGTFRGSEHDLRDGFIHFSAAHQVAETAAKHYTGEHDLVLLFVDVARVAGALRWEVSRNGERFPHLYAELSFDAVRRALPIELDGDGRHRFPPLD